MVEICTLGLNIPKLKSPNKRIWSLKSVDLNKISGAIHNERKKQVVIQRKRQQSQRK